MSIGRVFRKLRPAAPGGFHQSKGPPSLIQGTRPPCRCIAVRFEWLTRYRRGRSAECSSRQESFVKRMPDACRHGDDQAAEMPLDSCLRIPIPPQFRGTDIRMEYVRKLAKLIPYRLVLANTGSGTPKPTGCRSRQDRGAAWPTWPISGWWPPLLLLPERLDAEFPGQHDAGARDSAHCEKLSSGYCHCIILLSREGEYFYHDAIIRFAFQSGHNNRLLTIVG